MKQKKFVINCLLKKKEFMTILRLKNIKNYQIKKICLKI